MKNYLYFLFYYQHTEVLLDAPPPDRRLSTALVQSRNQNNRSSSGTSWLCENFAPQVKVTSRFPDFFLSCFSGGNHNPTPLQLLCL